MPKAFNYKIEGNGSIVSTKVHIVRRTQLARLKTAAIGCTMAAALTLPALAQNSSNQPLSKPTDTLNNSSISLNLQPDGLSFNTDATTSSLGSLGMLELPTESIGSTLFKLDLGNSDCLTGGTNCLSRDDTLDLGYSKRIASFSPKGIDISLTPRAAFRRRDDSSSAALGAVFEIGEDLRRSAGIDNNTWYIFAGADAEAFNYNSANTENLTRGQFHLQDSIFVGDARAGLGYRIGEADLSLSYNRREATTSNDETFTEDAAAISFTWRR